MASAWGSSWGSAWGNAWGSIASPDTHDGGSEHDYKRYREYLKRLTKVTEPKKITAHIQEIAEEIIELPVPTPEIKKLTIENPTIDFSALSREIERVMEYLKQMEKQIHLQREMDDELALLLLI